MSDFTKVIEWYYSTSDICQLFNAYGGADWTDRQLRLFSCGCCLLADSRDVDRIDLYEQKGYSIDGEKYTDRHWARNWATARNSFVKGRDKAVVFRDINGNPFYESFPTREIPDKVVMVAESIYKERDWEAMPMLSDLIEEADPLWLGAVHHLRGEDLCTAGCFYIGEKNYFCRVSFDMENHGDFVRCGKCNGTGFIPVETRHFRGCWVLEEILKRR